ncbi:hypothetical protein [Mucilaginibacter sp. CSA2-8R]|uniref:hypothetical protein n=1 Tax=Mucilaginibacter sp. CSA2-8R TaxID=3141542 RepID=UPI00315CDACC
MAEIHDECLFANRYTKSQRLQMYPFNKASKVMLISFKEDAPFPIKRGPVRNEAFLEKCTLNQYQVDSLTSLLYNLNYTPVKDLNMIVADPGANCYEPRNGILFLNKANKVFGYIEICFGCQRRFKSPGRINDGKYCAGKYELLDKFFYDAGIKYGTSESKINLSYQDILKLDTGDVAAAILEKLDWKTNFGRNLTRLSQVETVLYHAANTIIIKYSLARFFSSSESNYYKQAVGSLQSIKAFKAANILKASLKYWPGRKLPRELSERRRVLFKIYDKKTPKWNALIEDIEDLNGLIFEFLKMNQSKLVG